MCVCVCVCVCLLRKLGSKSGRECVCMWIETGCHTVCVTLSTLTNEHTRVRVMRVFMNTYVCMCVCVRVLAHICACVSTHLHIYNHLGKQGFVKTYASRSISASKCHAVLPPHSTIKKNTTYSTVQYTKICNRTQFKSIFLISFFSKTPPKTTTISPKKCNSFSSCS